MGLCHHQHPRRQAHPNQLLHQTNQTQECCLFIALHQHMESRQHHH